MLQFSIYAALDDYVDTVTRIFRRPYFRINKRNFAAIFDIFYSKMWMGILYSRTLY